jgi:acyl-CoA thioesterase FadM
VPALSTVDIRSYTWDQSVSRTAVGPSGFVHPQAVYQWIEEGVFDASAQGGWPFERCLAAGFVVFQMRHDTLFYAFPKLGDQLRFTNSLVDVRRLRGTWLNEIHRRSDGRLLARNYSTGVFLDLSGRPASPPEGMMDELRYG